MVGLKEMAQSDAERAPPAWLHRLLETRFFDACPKHPGNKGHANRRTTGCNFFCTQCANGALCSGCLSGHKDHEVIQTYLYNGEHIVFLNKRPMMGQGKRGASHCEECERGLQDAACRFCSFGCKAKGIEDELDFTVSFAVTPNNDSSGASSSTPIAARGQHSDESE